MIFSSDVCSAPTKCQTLYCALHVHPYWILTTSRQDSPPHLHLERRLGTCLRSRVLAQYRRQAVNLLAVHLPLSLSTAKTTVYDGPQGHPQRLYHHVQPVLISASVTWLEGDSQGDCQSAVPLCFCFSDEPGSKLQNRFGRYTREMGCDCKLFLSVSVDPHISQATLLCDIQLSTCERGREWGMYKGGWWPFTCYFEWEASVLDLRAISPTVPLLNLRFISPVSGVPLTLPLLL